MGLPRSPLRLVFVRHAGSGAAMVQTPAHGRLHRDLN